jgi:anion-transporting  ArsA/GET3 family ATPase
VRPDPESVKSPEPPGLLERRLVFVTGKGGVGKTTIAAALALLCAERGRRTLACDIDAKGDLTSFYETGPANFAGHDVLPNLRVMSMDTEASLREYLKLQLKIPVVGRIGPLAKAFDFVATAAPGVREILTVGKLCYEVRENHYDTIVVDATSTGHIVGQLAAPQAINQLVKVGLIRSQTDWMLDILSDSAQTGLLIVTTPEEMPVNETLELSKRVNTETTVDLAAVVVNRVLPELFARSEEKVFDELCKPESIAALERVVGADPVPVLDGARLAVRLRRTGAGHLDRLRTGLDPSVPMLLIPMLFTRRSGMRTTRQIARNLSEELGY